jgi:AcrR family transcriptional regulator
MATNELGRRERKKLATHRALRLAALRLGAEQGLQNVTVEDIAETADVSVRTFYDHFPSKEDAVVGFAPDRVGRLREALTSRPLGEAPLVALKAALCELLAEKSDELPLRMEIVRTDPALLSRMFISFAAYERVMVEVIASRTGTDPDRDLYPALTAAVATAVVRASMAFLRTSKGALSLPELLDAAFTEVGAGLPVPDAKRRAPRLASASKRARKA